MSTHAILSPSAAHRWLSCTPSARLETEFPDSESVYAAEGTLAHKLGELLIRKKLDLVMLMEYTAKLFSITENELYSDAMLDYCEEYADFVVAQFVDAQKRTKDALLFLEEQLDMTDYVPEGFGTGDVVIIADRILDMTDLKYGKGVMVSAEDNKQLKLYGLAAYRKYEMLYDIDVVRMTIYQPRMGNYSTWEVSVEDLLEWAETELKPKAALAFEGAGTFVAGKHCQFCRARAVCKANAEYNQELAAYDFRNPALLEDHDISAILDRAATFYTWLESVEEHALTEAVNRGKRWPGYKLVEGRSNRKYKDETEVAKLLLNNNCKEEAIYKKELLGITAMTKAIGKKLFETIVTPLLIKPKGKPTLAPETDKRPEYANESDAVADFTDQ